MGAELIPHILESAYQILIGRLLQFFRCFYSQGFHHELTHLPAGAYAVEQGAALNAAHDDAFVVKPIRSGRLQKGGHLHSASGLAEDGHISRISAKSCNVAVNPLQRGYHITGTCVAGVFVLFAEFGQIAVAQHIQPVIDGNKHNLPVFAEVFSFISHLLNG